MKRVVYPIAILGIPLLISLFIIQETDTPKNTFEVLVVQPNINPYTEKFTYNASTGEQNTTTFIPYGQQLEILFEINIFLLLKFL